MKQRYHTIIKPEPNGWFVGWVEEIPGTITQAKSLTECRENLRDALRLMIDTHRDEARMGLDASCLQESIEIDVLHANRHTLTHAQATPVHQLRTEPRERTELREQRPELALR